jgi:hypothetical protein
MVDGAQREASAALSPSPAVVGFNPSCAGLTRASIHLRKKVFAKEMDCRVKPGNDAGWLSAVRVFAQ